MVVKAINPKDDPSYIFKTPVEELSFFGENEQEKIMNAIGFSRLRSIAQRFGGQLTGDEFESLKSCMQTCLDEQ
jgi:hypothetical protein